MKRRQETYDPGTSVFGVRMAFSLRARRLRPDVFERLHNHALSLVIYVGRCGCKRTHGCDGQCTSVKARQYWQNVQRDYAFGKTTKQPALGQLFRPPLRGEFIGIRTYVLVRVSYTTSSSASEEQGVVPAMLPLLYSNPIVVWLW